MPCAIRSPKDVVDLMEVFIDNGADGFMLTATPNIFEDLITTEMQKRGLFRAEYRCSSQRENLLEDG